MVSQTPGVTAGRVGGAAKRWRPPQPTFPSTVDITVEAELKEGGGGSKGASRQGLSVSSWGPLGDEGKDGGRCEESPPQVATLRKPLLYQGD